MKWHGAWLDGVHRTCQDSSSFTWHQPCQRSKHTLQEGTGGMLSGPGGNWTFSGQVGFRCRQHAQRDPKADVERKLKKFVFQVCSTFRINLGLTRLLPLTNIYFQSKGQQMHSWQWHEGSAWWVSCVMPYLRLKSLLWISDLTTADTLHVRTGSWDSSVVRVPASWSKGCRLESWREQQENFLLQGQLSVLSLVLVSVPLLCYPSST